MSYAANQYMHAIQEVKQWLTYKKMQEFVYLLVDNGYDHLPSIAKANTAEQEELATLFRTQDSMRNIRMLVECLARMGIEEYRDNRAEFRRLLALEQEKVDAENELAIAMLFKEAFLGIKTVSEPEWLDKYCIQEGNTFKWVKSKVSREVEVSINMAGATVKMDSNDRSKIRIEPHPGVGASIIGVELACESPEQAADWMRIFNIAKGAPLPVEAPNTPSSPTHNSKPPVHARIQSSVMMAVEADTKDDGHHNNSELSSVVPSTTQSSTLAHKKSRTYLRLLRNGTVFKKYKGGKSGNKRMIWCTYALDHVLWGNESKDEVKGFIHCHDLTDVTQGFGEDRCKLTLQARNRTLELEGRNPEMTKDWFDAFEYLIKMQNAGDEKRLALSSTDAYKHEVMQLKSRYKQLLTKGNIFKKWPHKMSFHKSSSVRRFYFSDDLSALHWADIATKKVKGSCDTNDIVEIIGDEKDLNNLKFIILAKNRTLVAEAKDQETRIQWMEALRFIIQHKL